MKMIQRAETKVVYTIKPKNLDEEECIEMGQEMCGLECPLGGDETNDCADCVYSGDYHFVNGECVEREEETK